jgi:hypothetical protein
LRVFSFMKKLDRLPKEQANAIVRVLGEHILAHGKRENPESMDSILPLWKKHGLYEQCVGISSKLVNVHLDSKRIRAAIAKMDMPAHISCTRDFLEGVVLSAGEEVRGKYTVYPSYEFIGAAASAHVTDFLRECGVEFVQFKEPRSRYLARTKPIPFMGIKPAGDKEQQIAGMIAGGSPKYIDDSLYIVLKPACAKMLTSMGMHYDFRDHRGKGRRIYLSAFYLPLYISDMPPHFFDYWLQYMPLGNCPESRAAAFVALMHWRIMFGKTARIKGAIPYLLERDASHDLGHKVSDALRAVSDRKMDFVDRRLTKRIKRWMLTQMGEDGYKIFLKEKGERHEHQRE